MNAVKWQSVPHDHVGWIYRTRTPLGWLVRHFIDAGGLIGDSGTVETMAEVYDPEHTWLEESE